MVQLNSYDSMFTKSEVFSPLPPFPFILPVFHSPSPQWPGIIVEERTKLPWEPEDSEHRSDSVLWTNNDSVLTHEPTGAVVTRQAWNQAGQRQAYNVPLHREGLTGPTPFEKLLRVDGCWGRGEGFSMAMLAGGSTRLPTPMQTWEHKLDSVGSVVFKDMELGGSGGKFQSS